MRGSLEERLHIAEEIADKSAAKDTDRLRALDFLGKYGLGEAGVWDEEKVEELLVELGEVVERVVDDSERLTDIEDGWRDVIRRHQD